MSCLKYKDHFGINLDDSGNINFEKYLNVYGKDVVIEYDQRFYCRDDLVSEKHEQGRVYGNIIDEDIDFIGKYENLIDDIRKIKNILNVDYEFEFHEERSNEKINRDLLNEYSLEKINKIYSKDMLMFGY